MARFTLPYKVNHLHTDYASDEGVAVAMEGNGDYSTIGTVPNQLR